MSRDLRVHFAATTNAALTHCNGDIGHQMVCNSILALDPSDVQVGGRCDLCVSSHGGGDSVSALQWRIKEGEWGMSKVGRSEIDIFIVYGIAQRGNR